MQSTDNFLKLENLKLELLVIVRTGYYGEYRMGFVLTARQTPKNTSAENKV